MIGIPRLLGVVSWIVLLPILSSAQSTRFAYQGKLTDGSLPAAGAYDMRFSLHSAVADGVALGSPVYVDDELAADGLFTAELDFGAEAFDGSDRWIEIAVRPGSADNADRTGYTVLAPRQRIAATPYALRSQSAATASTADRATTSTVADTAGNADTVDGLHAADFAPVAHGHNLQDLAGILSDGQIPAGIARDSEVASGLATKADAAHSHDKTALNNAGALGFVWMDSEVADNLTIHSGTLDNTPIGTTLPTTAFFTHVGTNGNVVLGDASDDQITVNGAIKIASGSPGANKVLTSDAVGNATWKTNNADTLDGLHAAAFQQHYENMLVVAKSGGEFSTITEALNNTKYAADDYRYLIFVAPGIYNEQVTMKSYVDIQGAGEQTTLITQPGSSDYDTGTVLGADHAELRNLTVENTGTNAYANGIYNSSTSPRISHVTIKASGGTVSVTGISNNGASPKVRHVVITVAQEDTLNTGIYNVSSSQPEIEDVTINVSQGEYNYGVRSRLSSVLILRNAQITVSGPGTNIAVVNACPATLWNVIAAAQGSSVSLNYGFWNEDVVHMTHILAEIRGGYGNYGVRNSGGTVTLTNAKISASDGAGNNYGVYSDANSVVTMNQVVAEAATGTNAVGFYNWASSFIGNNCAIAGTGATNNHGIFNTATAGSYTVTLNNCQITGTSSTIRNDTEFTLRIGGSLLNGGAVLNPGACTCAGVYDENYVFTAGPACP